MSLGTRIRDLRKAAGLTQKEIATKLGMGSSNFGHIENDRVVPTSKDLDKIAEILNTSTDYLLGRSSDQASEMREIPEWATAKDRRDFKTLLEEDTEIMFDGVPLSKDDKQRVMDVLTGLFWEAKGMNKRKKNPDPNDKE